MTFKMTSRNLLGTLTRQGQLKITFHLISMRIAQNLTTNTSTESSECTESLHSNIRRLIFLSHFAGLCARCNFHLAQSFIAYTQKALLLFNFNCMSGVEKSAFDKSLGWGFSHPGVRTKLNFHQ
jgi:hypothetical protein